MGAGSTGSAGGGADRDRTLLLDALDVTISPGLLERALTHRSYAYENGGLPTNERLEFLGDSVLGLVVTDTLFREHPDLPEGQLAKLRAAVVQMRALAGVARELRLGEFIRLGRGEEGTGGRDKPSILADTLEAVIGAVYTDCGLDVASRLVHRLFDPVIANSAQLGAGLDWKTSLQELTAAEFLGVPEYRVEESGPDHQKSFRATVRVAGRPVGSGEGRSKKEAEQQAAQAAYTAIKSGPGSEAGSLRNPNGTAPGATGPRSDAGRGSGGAIGSAETTVGPGETSGSRGSTGSRSAAGTGGSAGLGGAVASGTAAGTESAAGSGSSGGSGGGVPPSWRND